VPSRGVVVAKGRMWEAVKYKKPVKTGGKGGQAVSKRTYSKEEVKHDRQQNVLESGDRKQWKLCVHAAQHWQPTSEDGQG